MRNKIICILFAAFLCMILCGCGINQTGNRPGTNDMDILPDVTPMISPDTQDGVVNDHDGVIGNSHTDGADHDDHNDGGTSGTANGGTNGTASGGTSSGTSGGTSPTTAPGTTQNP